MTVSDLRQHLHSIVDAALHASDAGTLVRRALDDPGIGMSLRAAIAVDVVAAGKAAAPMRDAFVRHSLASLRGVVTTGPETGHPLPNDASVAAARRALDVAHASGETDLLVVLLSGGASAKMALPVDGVTLADKQETARRLLAGGADIHRLNTVRKHLSAIKGGQLAAAARGRVLTFAVSDVIGDDLSMIASGPTVADATTYAEALAVLDAHGGRSDFPPAVVRHLERGATGAIADTPKPGDERIARSKARIIGNRFTAVEAARIAAERLGYHVHVIDEPITGEARVAGRALIARAASVRAARRDAALCVLASGESTVTVKGRGRGGRNQELVLAMLPHLPAADRLVAASIGTDGIDGPTDAAGALVDSTTAARAAAGLLAPERYLDDNDSYTFFDALGDLIRTGPTATNVGDLQIILLT